MKIRKPLIALAVILAVASLAGCAPSKPVSTGAFEGNVYTNDFFGMTFAVPEDWTILSKDEMAALFGQVIDEIGSTDKDAEAKMKLAEKKSLYLAVTAKYPIDYTEDTNPNINVIAENLGLMSFVVSKSKDYMEATMTNLKPTVAEGVTFGEISTETVGGVEYSSFDMTTDDGSGYTMYQRFICTMKNKYAILFTMTWFEEDQLKELQSVIDSIEIK